jgi:hypothetical protein
MRRYVFRNVDSFGSEPSAFIVYNLHGNNIFISDSHGGVYEETVFYDIAPCSLVVNRRFRGPSVSTSEM